MEWMLQAVDEVDDAVGALRLVVMGWSAEIGRLNPRAAKSFKMPHAIKKHSSILRPGAHHRSRGLLG
jgi:hypothetical protein